MNNKQTLLQLLREDDDVRAAILEVIQGQTDQSIEMVAAPEAVPTESASSGEEIEMIETIQKMLNKLMGNVQSSQEQQEHLQYEFAALQQQYDDVQKSHQQLDAALHQAEADKADCQSRLNESTKTLAFYEKNFSPFVKAFDRYKSLGEKSKTPLKGVFPTESLVGFVVAGVQYRNVETLYEYVKNEATEGKNPDVSALIDIYQCFLNDALLAFPKYQQLSPKKGDLFQATDHINVGDGVSGTIQEVLLPGWEDTQRQKIVNQPVVRIKGA